MPNLRGGAHTTVLNNEVMLSSDEFAVCARLRGGRDAITPGMFAAARRHRVHFLLAATMSPEERETLDGTTLGRDTRVAAALDAWQQQDLTDLLDAFARSGVDALVFKGAALAHIVYSEPHLRPRTDVDLLVRAGSRAGADRVLIEHGWSRPVEPERELASAQQHYEKVGPAGSRAHVDLHWKIANPHVFGDALPFDDLYGRAMPVPALGRATRAPGLVDALLLACMHRVAHHEDAIDLLWLWDIHLLTERLSADDRAALTSLSQRTGMSAVCERGIGLALELFGTEGAGEVVEQLRSALVDADEASARFIGGVPPVAVLREDLIALSSWRARTRLVTEHLFPSLAYMRVRYPRWPSVLLPFAYADRIARGVPKWLRRS